MKTRLGIAGFTGLVALVFQIQALAQTDTPEALTYNGIVGRIINDNCVICHREGGIGPMQLTTYEQVRPWAPLIQYKVARREMPPYAYDHGIGIQELEGDWRLTQDQVDSVVAWVNQGAPLGDPDATLPAVDLPDPNAWTFAQQFGEPSLVIASIPIDIPASGNDLWTKHYVTSGLEVDRCIKAVQVKPRGEAKAVVHHANSMVEAPDENGEFKMFGMLTEYAMGKWGEIVPEGVCRTLPAGARISWDIHMFPGGIGAVASGTMIKDNVVEVGIWFHPEDYEQQGKTYRQDLNLYQISPQDDLIIEPNGYTMTQGFHSFDHPVRIDSFQPHGHLRMNAASLEIFYPATGRTEQISQISHWSAIWHHSHIYASDSAPLLPAGAVLVLKQWYDNTAANPNNPDPDQWVFGGSRTADEMTHAWLAITHLDEEGYARLVAERKQKQERSLAGSD